MSIFDFLKKKRQLNSDDIDSKYPHEFCPRCEANITLQKGYSNHLPYWICRGCGEYLINPEGPISNDIVWICDECGDVLNLQEGFRDDIDKWECRKCGFANKICDEEVYPTEDAYIAEKNNPYKGMDSESVIKVLSYTELENIGGRENVILVEDENQLYVKKTLDTYDISVYRDLMDNPVGNMPKIYGVYEGENHVIVIEEYIKGKTLRELLDERTFEPAEALRIIKEVCTILKRLHSFEPPIIHRDVKPENIIITDENEVYLLDINVAKRYNAEEVEDTVLLGTKYYAAPEQYGFGYTASSVKTDIWPLGIILNELITGEFPKIKKASGRIAEIVDRCTRYEADERYDEDELVEALENVARETTPVP